MRECGVLLPIPSLPGPGPIGEFGNEARKFAAFLERAGQRVWQILPLTITGEATGNSPFSSLSAFAIDPLFLSLDDLRCPTQDSATSPGEARAEGLSEAGRVDYSGARSAKAADLGALLDSPASAATDLGEALADFRRREADWLEDFALFAALRGRYELRTWTDWPAPLRDREPEALNAVRAELAREIERQVLEQFLVHRQWTELHRECRRRGVRVLGDLPFYVSHDSADVWSHRRFFQLAADGTPRRVAGVPPDYFSATGQLWGNPVYDWDVMEEDGYSWWVRRLARQLQLFDSVRIDHFRGFAAYWSVPADAETAADGEWVDGPGVELFDTLRRELGALPLVAEDLGVIDEPVRELLDSLDMPGIRVLQFAFHADEESENPHHPDRYPERVVAYSGTHDNNTLRGWFEEEASAEELAALTAWLGREVAGEEITGAIIEKILSCRAELAIVPLQDLLDLGSEARMNRPSAPSGNWEWRARGDQITGALAADLRRRTETSGR